MVTDTWPVISASVCSVTELVLSEREIDVGVGVAEAAVGVRVGVGERAPVRLGGDGDGLAP